MFPMSDIALNIFNNFLILTTNPWDMYYDILPFIVCAT